MPLVDGVDDDEAFSMIRPAGGDEECSRRPGWVTFMMSMAITTIVPSKIAREDIGELNIAAYGTASGSLK